MDDGSDEQFVGVEYGTTTAYGGSTTVDPTLVLSHSPGLTGLTPATTYHYRVTSVNGVGLAVTSTDFTFLTVDYPHITAGPSASGITGVAATITWTTDVNSDSVVEYGTSTTYGGTTSVGTPVTGHSVNLTGLTPGTLYHYRVKSTNGVTLTATSGDFTFTTVDYPHITLGPTVTGITGTAATINWTTDQTSDTVVDYGTTTAYGSTSSNGSLVTGHSRNLTGLTPGTLYHYRVKSTSGVALTVTSADFTFTTVNYAVISLVNVTNITGTSATVNWHTNQAATSQVEYGTSTSYGSTTAVDLTLVADHSMNLASLNSGTTYHYRILTTNGVGLTTTSGDFTFTTVAFPIISNVQVTLNTGTSVTITWTTNQPATSQVDYGLNSSYGSQMIDPPLVTSHSVCLTGLTPGTVYHYAVRSTNSVGLSSTPGDAVFTTAGPPIISGVGSSAVTASAATIAWTTDQSSDSEVDYGLTTTYGGIATSGSMVTSHSLGLTGLSQGVTYHYRVKSTNAATQTSTSGDFTFTTATAPIITPGAVTSISAGAATINWTTNQNADSVVEYGADTTYGNTATSGTMTTSHALTLTGLTAGTLYHYRMKSTNAFAMQTVSGDFAFSTTGYPVITMQPATGITGSSATINWLTDQLTDSKVEFGPTTAYGSFTALDTNMVTSHAVTMTGLFVGYTYHYRVYSKNGDGLDTVSSDSYFTTDSPPSLSNFSVSNITSSSATVCWWTNQASDSRVDFGLTASYTAFVTDPAMVSIPHCVDLTGLSAGTTYHYMVTSTNASLLSTSSSDAQFTTSPFSALAEITGKLPLDTDPGVREIVWIDQRELLRQTSY